VPLVAAPVPRIGFVLVAASLLGYPPTVGTGHDLGSGNLVLLMVSLSSEALLAPCCVRKFFCRR
jgi:hypothetical protein